MVPCTSEICRALSHSLLATPPPFTSSLHLASSFSFVTSSGCLLTPRQSWAHPLCSHSTCPAPCFYDITSSPEILRTLAPGLCPSFLHPRACSGYTEGAQGMFPGCQAPCYAVQCSLIRIVHPGSPEQSFLFSRGSEKGSDLPIAG